MTRWECDYAEGAHPKILQRLCETNLEQTPGYGLDSYCEHARSLICAACERPDAEVHFLVGGTQANFTIIASALRPWQGVLCAQTAHINVHETGAIEATGHKVLALPHTDGKITACQIRSACEAHWSDANHEHIVQPGMVYLSHPTELGTLYTFQELSEISRVCREYQLTLFVDGARLGYGLAAEGSLTLPQLASLCDVFYIGGTKVGALFGEAVVICNDSLKRDFRYGVKQHGGMLAKGRLLGIQFETLFTDNLYLSIAKQAVALALQLRDALAKKGYTFLFSSPTNQQFPVLPNAVYETLRARYAFTFWEIPDETHTAVRICTSWATTPEQVRQLLEAFPEL